MIRNRTTGIAALAIVALVLVSAVNAVAASNTVPESVMEDSSQTISVDDRKPEECDSITVTTGQVGTGNLNGTTASELLLGGPNVQTIDGAAGNDCILGGGGNDTLRGNTGNDVVLGGPGNDSLAGGGGTDICIGGEGTDTFNNDCETRIQ